MTAPTPVQVWEDANGALHRSKSAAERANRRSDLIGLCETFTASDIHDVELLADWIEENRQPIANYLGVALKD